MIDIPSNPPVAMALDGHVGIVEVQKPPHNFFDQVMLSSIADAFETFETNPQCRAIVLCAQGTSFCAGADFSKRDNAASGNTHRSPRAVNPIYGEAVRLFAATKPVICAVQGPAIGGGLGLAMVGDFRVACPEARFAANFNRLGFHPGFGLSVTLPRLVEAVRSAVAHESIEQSKHYQTEDFKEGIAASAARRDPAFKGV